jgi:NADH:ubiquinone oxidoreductase subunit H
MKFGLFYMAEYAHILLAPPGEPLFPGRLERAAAACALWLLVKVFFVFALFIWVRATFPASATTS